jgi:hypothetical protein
MTTDSGKTFQPLLTENGLSATTGFGLTSGTSTVTLYILGKTIGVLKFPFVGGTAGTAELSADAEVRWDTVNIGSTLSKNVTIRNTGTAALSVSSAVITPGSGSTAGEFSISGTVAPLLPGESGTYSVAFAPSAEGSRTATMTVTSNGGTKSIALVGIGKTFINSVDESSELAAARVFPMPSRGSLTIECASLPDGVYDVELLGMTGRRVYSHRVEAHAAQMSITPDQLAPGLYAVRILSSGKILATTFFVNE